jgi:hypothetical protein
MDEFARICPVIKPPSGTLDPPLPPPIGHQLIVFAEAPEDAPNANFEVIYDLKEGSAPNRFVVVVKVSIRTKVEEDPVEASTLGVPREFTLDQLEGEDMDVIRDRIVSAMVGKH